MSSDDALPVGNSEALWYRLLTGLIAKNGTATAEDLRPLVREQMNISQRAVTIRSNSYKATISNALIQMAKKDLVSRPFGRDVTLSNMAMVRWFSQNRPRQQRQIVWQITDVGRTWVADIEASGKQFIELRRFFSNTYSPQLLLPDVDFPPDEPEDDTPEVVTTVEALTPDSVVTLVSDDVDVSRDSTIVPEQDHVESGEPTKAPSIYAQPWPENEGVDAETAHFLTLREERYSSTGVFDPKDPVDSRERTLAAVVRRRGQPEFRRQLLQIYQGRCVITGSDAEPALEAAHITPYRGDQTNHPSNGLLLRADIHTLFDLKLPAIDTESSTVLVSPVLMKTCYRELQGQPVSLPPIDQGGPSIEALNLHREDSGLSFPAELTS